MKYWNWIKRTPFNLKSTWKFWKDRGRKGLPLLCPHRHSSILNLLWQQWFCCKEWLNTVWIQLLLYVWIAFLVLCLCVYAFHPIFIYLFIEKCVLRENVHGIHCFFDSKIFIRICLVVDPSVFVLRLFFIIILFRSEERRVGKECLE